MSQELRAAELLLNDSIIVAVVYHYTSLSACLGARIFGRSLRMVDYDMLGRVTCDHRHDMIRCESSIHGRKGSEDCSKLTSRSIGGDAPVPATTAADSTALAR